MLEVRLLGQFNVRLNGLEVNIHSRAEQSLLAYLILNAGKTYRREYLAGLFWPDSDETNAKRYLRQALWRLRRTIAKQAPDAPDYFQAEKITLEFDPRQPYWLDVAVLEEEEGESLDVLLTATKVYAGELLPGFYDEWVSLERERLRALFERKMQRLLEKLGSARRWKELFRQAERWIALGGTPEPAYQALIVAYAAQGDKLHALIAYEQLTRALDQKLSAAPSPETTLLVEQIRSGNLPVQADPGRKIKHPHNLPAQPTPLIGRENELAQIMDLLAAPTCRLLTLAGPGGIGKSRLALQAAQNLVPNFKHGTWFVHLDSLDSVGHLEVVIANTLGLPQTEPTSPAEQLLEYLRRKDLLLVLDNFEHLLPHGTGLLIEILQEAPGVNLLVTSREKLNLRAEYILEIQGLDYPRNGLIEDTESYPAMVLFAQLARQASGFPLSAEDLPWVAQVTQRVEGSPLALELAAAWTRALSCREIADEVEHGLNILEGDFHDLPDRHRSMRAVFDRSWQLLSKYEQAVFRRLSVFRGGFERQAAEQVARASLEMLVAMVDKSLVQHDPDGRYRIHELLRQYAAGELEKAGESKETHERHLAYFLKLAKEAEPALRGSQQHIWLTRLQNEHNNLRAALQWSIDNNNADIALQLSGFLWFYWWFRGYYSEGRDLLEKALKLANPLGNVWRAKALNGAGVLARNQGDYSNARAYLEESLEIYNELEDWTGVANVLNGLGVLAQFQGDIDQAFKIHQEGLAIRRKSGDKRGQAVSLNNLAMVMQEKGEYAQVEKLYRESMSLFQEVNDARGIGAVLLNWGHASYDQEEGKQSEDLLRRSLEILRNLGQRNDIIECLESLAGVAASFQQPYRGARLFYAAQSFREEIGSVVPHYHVSRYQNIVKSITPQLDSRSLENERAAGREMTWEDAIEFALS